ncbi:hypothetical protein [Pectobacterium aquaticum]|uniref:hypothetical protein n=1 Tax=Pectobacterium aquaticum TaxID=2204145 RepID=UPI00142E3CA0|nr:hypothetical protein [Pectobacterium aquaticum]UEM41520.1 hypothetical protein DMB82_0014465 [Pectobacterium aquaticum]
MGQIADTNFTFNFNQPLAVCHFIKLRHDRIERMQQSRQSEIQLRRTCVLNRAWLQMMPYVSEYYNFNSVGIRMKNRRIGELNNFAK